MSARDDVAPSEDFFDLSSCVQSTTAKIALIHPPTGVELPARITIAGPEHDARKNFVFARMRQRRAEFERTGKLTTSDPTEDAEDELAMLVACTLGWERLGLDGKLIAYSPAEARRIYSDPRWSWVRDQVKQALDDRARFFEGSALP